MITYPGQVLRAEKEVLVLRTTWTGGTHDLGFVVLEPTDEWTEYFFPGRWYNIFEIRTEHGQLKGWYCNITRPPRISETEIAAEDLALDVWVTPERQATVLDEDEFQALSLTSHERSAARSALRELLARVAQGEFPFGSTK